MDEYQILLDIWEGNPDLDVPTLKANGVVGMIVRLNDMNGGHHMDERFVQDWATALQFPVQSIYFVYNPWVSGRANLDWLVAHLPPDFDGRRLLIDTEVKYPGYSPDTYAKETQIFYGLVSARFPEAIYTGEWFLPIIARWPKTIDYWWAAYPDALQGITSWEKLCAILSKTDFSFWTMKSPGPARLWQFSGGGNTLPGFGNHGVDISVFPGTLEECKQWFHIPQSDPPSEGEPSMAWRENPHMLVVYHGQTVNVAEARKQGYSAICAYLSEGDVKVERSWLRELSKQCKGVVPLLVMWGVIPAYEGYSMGQPTADPQVNALLFTLEEVEYAGIVMNVESPYKWQTKIVATPANIGKAAEAFYNTVVKQTGKPVYVRCTDDFVQKYTVASGQRFMSWLQGKNYWIAEHAYRIVNGADTKWFSYPTGKVVMTLEELRKRVYAPDVTHTPPDESKNPLVPEEAVKKVWEFSWALHTPTNIVFDSYGKLSNAAVALSFAPDEASLWAELNFSQTLTVPVDPPVEPGDPPTPPTDPGQLDRIEKMLQEIYPVIMGIKAL